MGQTQIKVEVKIEPGEPTPAQAALWRQLFAKLLQGLKQTDEAATGPGEGGNESTAIK
jgi:hypothetical protein